jgi:hypothetical protein
MCSEFFSGVQPYEDGINIRFGDKISETLDTNYIFT